MKYYLKVKNVIIQRVREILLGVLVYLFIQALPLYLVLVKGHLQYIHVYAARN